MNRVYIKIIWVLSLPNLFMNFLVFTFSKVNTKKFTICGVIFIRNRGSICIDENFKGNSGKKCNPIGGDIILRLITGPNGCIKIGKNVGISNSTIYSIKEIVIEDGVLIGGGCRIWDSNFHSLEVNIRGTKSDRAKTKSASILIKKKAFIGGGTIILKGVTIGLNSIVAAGSVVVKSIPDNEVWGGNPAKFIKKIN